MGNGEGQEGTTSSCSQRTSTATITMTMTTTPTTPTSTSTSTMTVTSMAMPFVPVESEASISSSATDQRQQRRWQWQQAPQPCAATTCPITATSSSTYLSATPSSEASKLSTNVLFSLPASPKRSAPESSSKTPAISKSQMKGEFFYPLSNYNHHRRSRKFRHFWKDDATEPMQIFSRYCEFVILVDN